MSEAIKGALRDLAVRRRKLETDIFTAIRPLMVEFESDTGQPVADIDVEIVTERTTKNNFPMLFAVHVKVEIDR